MNHKDELLHCGVSLLFKTASPQEIAPGVAKSTYSPSGHSLQHRVASLSGEEKRNFTNDLGLL
ncbi:MULTISPECIES: hypothetical protein [Nostocales]|uniref:hypothetical protein n=1 Tax=Nostocales TaxID=1161 RepID=UPI000AA0EE4F|nr:hypothetical protein [Tolypothrix bouteillei]